MTDQAVKRHQVVRISATDKQLASWLDQATDADSAIVSICLIRDWYDSSVGVHRGDYVIVVNTPMG